MARTAALGTLVSITLIATACTSVGGEVSSERSDDNTDSVETTGTTDDSNAVPLAWEPCEDGGNTAVELDCVMLLVPLDYDAPDGDQIEIAVARSAAIGAADGRIGSLVFNPGGPGGSGIEALGFLPLTMSSDILERFDLVSFDPRGVGASTALNCTTDIDDEVALRLQATTPVGQRCWPKARRNSNRVTRQHSVWRRLSAPTTPPGTWIGCVALLATPD